VNVYVFQAALYCEECGEDLVRKLDMEGKTPETPCDENSYDSDDYPKGPYTEEQVGESDSPSHCDACNKFLESPLTKDGLVYVLETVLEDLENGRRDSVACRIWAPFYRHELLTEFTHPYR